MEGLLRQRFPGAGALPSHCPVPCAMLVQAGSDDPKGQMGHLSSSTYPSGHLPHTGIEALPLPRTLITPLATLPHTGVQALLLPGTHITPCGGDLQLQQLPAGGTAAVIAQLVRSQSQADIRRLGSRVVGWLDAAADQRRRD